MKILVINSGSSSLKFKLISTGKNNSQIAKGNVDGIGLNSCRFTYKSKEKDLGLPVKIKNHKEALKLVLETLVQSNTLESLKEIDAVGHRVVHGGEKYSKPVKLDATVIKQIEKLKDLAPLHNPANLQGIKACKEVLPKVKQVAIFDTAFHQTMPKKAFMYAIPEELYEKHHIRKYGFHGTSHKYVIGEALKLMKKKNAKIISCHIGNGSSITAYDGKSVDTSMGFTPLEGLLMGTRCGALDPSVILFLEEKLGLTSRKIKNMLNHESGLKAISELSSDMRKIFQASKKGSEHAKLAIHMLAYQIAKFCGAYAAAMNGVDAIIFTGGLGEKAYYVRDEAMDYLEFLGVKIDDKENKKCAELISSAKSKVKVFVIPTNEELQIAKETEKTLKKK